jgi:hypothetical protein
VNKNALGRSISCGRNSRETTKLELRFNQQTNKNKGSASASSPAKQKNKFPDIEGTAPGQEEEEEEEEEEEKCFWNWRERNYWRFEFCERPKLELLQSSKSCSNTKSKFWMQNCGECLRCLLRLSAVGFKRQGRTTSAFLLLNLPSFPLATGTRERERERGKKNY